MPVDNPRTVELLQVAHKAVRDSGIPDSLAEAGFAKAFDHLAYSESASLPDPTADASGAPQSPRPGEAGSRLDGIASKFRVDRELIGEVFHEDGENLGLSLSASRFASSKKRATEQIALLVAAGRQAGGWDSEWTPSGTIRKVVDEYGKFDEKNYAATLLAMQAEFGFTGSGVNRKVKVNRVGYERAGELVQELTGGENS